SLPLRGARRLRWPGRDLPRRHQRLPRRPRRVRPQRPGDHAVKFLERVFPSPLLAAALAVMWLALQGSVAPFDVVFGVALGAALSRVMLRLDPDPPAIRKPRQVLALTGVVLYDILASNLRMFSVILSPRRAPRSRFVNIPQ